MDEAKRDEYISELAEAFGTFGTVLTTEVRIRDKFEDGQHKVSWGLVTFNNEVAAQKAVDESASLGRPGWVVKVRRIHFLGSWHQPFEAPTMHPCLPRWTLTVVVCWTATCVVDSWWIHRW